MLRLQEILKARGLDDETIKGITEDMKTKKVFIAGEENLDIRYSKLKTDHENLTAQHAESTKLIDQLKAGTKDNEALQGKVTNYESTIANLTEQLKQSQIDSEAKIALLGAKVTDVDYMMFRLKEKGDLELDDQGHIKNIDDRLAGLKTQFPAFFESAGGQREVQPQRLPDRNATNDSIAVTKEQFNTMGYKSRVELKQNNPELYEKLKG